MNRVYRYGELPWRCIQQRYNKRGKEPMQQKRRWMALQRTPLQVRRNCDLELQIVWGIK